MKKPSIAIALLGAALLMSNIAWAFRVLDLGASLTYERASVDSEHDALTRALAVIPAAAKDRSSKDEIIDMARKNGYAVEAFEKDGFTWIGTLGLRFDANGRVVEACAVTCGESSSLRRPSNS